MSGIKVVVTDHGLKNADLVVGQNQVEKVCFISASTSSVKIIVKQNTAQGEDKIRKSIITAEPPLHLLMYFEVVSFPCLVFMLIYHWMQ